MMTDENNYDAYKPAKIAVLVEGVGVNKAHLPPLQMFVLAILAGAFIGFGAAAYTMVMTGADASFGPARLLGGIVFSLGLILVIIGGAELFTGNALMVMARIVAISEVSSGRTSMCCMVKANASRRLRIAGSC
jgi:formate/nitrite transporter FocA (FNT family)